MHGTPPVRFELSPAPGLAALIVLAHAAVAACFLTVMTGWPAVLLAVLALALGCAAAWDRALLRGSGSPRGIEVQPSGEAFCRFADGGSAALAPLGGSAVTRFWAAFGLRAARRRSLLVTAGMLEPESFRRLRLWALWGRVPGQARPVASGQLPA